jgi:hypothetical protein
MIIMEEVRENEIEHFVSITGQFEGAKWRIGAIFVQGETMADGDPIIPRRGSNFACESAMRESNEI